MEKLIALVDCNNFFVSCERLFRPDLNGKPVAVLSNNDGCIVSRSQEVKKLGIPMGAPIFKYKAECERHNVTLFSSNFALYGDMSNRVMSILEEFSPDIEIYSIDEAFLSLDLTTIKNPTEYGKQIAQKVRMHTGIPVSVGIASTKTLAKIAGSIVKSRQIKDGVFDFSALNEFQKTEMLKEIEIGDIWGIGRNRAELLSKNGMYTVYDFIQADRTWIREKLSVQGERIQLELQNINCFNVDDNPTPSKGIMSTRSFGKPVTTLEELKQSVSTHITNASRKLRQQKSVAGQMTIFIRTSFHNRTHGYFSTAANISLPTPTDDPLKLVKEGLRGLEQVFKAGELYKKAGIYLTDISPKDSFKMGLFTDHSFQDEKRTDLIQRIDQINNSYGFDIVRHAVQGFDQKWKVKSEHISSRYTTKWSELPVVRI